MNILVPIDFSPASLNAFYYACETAVSLNGQIFLLHIVSSRKKYEEEKEKLEEVQELERKMTRFGRIYPNQNGHVQTSVMSTINLIRIGKMEEVISAVCKSKKIDLIVLGTKNKHSLLDYVLGSISTILTQYAPCPLIIVPEKAKVEPIRRIAIASDEEESFEPFVNYVNDFSKKLKAKVERVYVYPLPRDISDKKEETYNPTWFDEQVDPDAKIFVVRDFFVVRGLDYFIEKHQIDLLAMYVPERKGLQKMFHRSLSKRMAYHSLTPLLIWNDKIP